MEVLLDQDAADVVAVGTVHAHWKPSASLVSHSSHLHHRLRGEKARCWPDTGKSHTASGEISGYSVTIHRVFLVSLCNINFIECSTYCLCLFTL